MALPRLRTRMAEVNEWKSEIVVFGEGRSAAPWAIVERFGAKTPNYYWRAKRPDSTVMEGWTDSLEDAQRLAEDWLFPDPQ